MPLEILTGSKIQVFSSRKQVIAFETIPYNLQIPHSLAQHSTFLKSVWGK